MHDMLQHRGRLWDPVSSCIPCHGHRTHYSISVHHTVVTKGQYGVRHIPMQQPRAQNQVNLLPTLAVAPVLRSGPNRLFVWKWIRTNVFFSRWWGILFLLGTRLHPIHHAYRIPQVARRILRHRLLVLLNETLILLLVSLEIRLVLAILLLRLFPLLFQIRGGHGRQLGKGSQEHQNLG